MKVNIECWMVIKKDFMHKPSRDNFCDQEVWTILLVNSQDVTAYPSICLPSPYGSFAISFLDFSKRLASQMCVLCIFYYNFLCKLIEKTTERSSGEQDDKCNL